VRRARRRPAAAALLAVGIVAGSLAACGDDGTDGSAPEGSAVEDGDGGLGSEPTEGAGGQEAPTPLGDVELRLTEVAQFDTPISIVPRPGDTALFVAEREGRVRRVEVTGEGTDRRYQPVEQPLLDISDRVLTEGERGLLDIEFSPDGARLYVSYSLAPEGISRVESFAYDGTTLDTASRREILSVEDFAPNHNGGDLEFGPDGFLYVAMGDGGGAGDPEGNGQDTGSLLGKLLRIDPEGAPQGQPYAVPEDNPFAGGAAGGGGGAPEVWLYGVRNPWRFSFDRETDDLWIADVGQADWEEIDLLPATDGAGRGANLGWSEMEGSHPFEGGTEPEGAVLPIFEYPTGEEGACAVTGGFVYRGQAVPALQGAYLFGDFCASPLRALRVEGGQVADDRIFEGVDVPQLVSFGEDNEGELYAVSLSGPILRLDA
jgi:glucose/arabinose dehydrogenase